MSVPIGFKDQAEYDQWLADLHGSFDKLRKVGEELDKKALAAKADAVSALGGGILGTALPEEVADALKYASRINGFLPFVPDSMVPHWARKLGELLDLIRRSLGINSF